MMIGLTGSIASGKSTVANYLRELGAEVIDADQVARQVVSPGTPALKEIVNSFGPSILQDDGTLNRKKMASIVFQDAKSKDKLESIIHPRIEEEIDRQMRKFTKTRPTDILVLEVPLLIEVGWHKKVDQVWLVAVDPAEQLRRLMARDKISLAEAQARIASQMPQAEKMKNAHVVIHNNGSPEEVKQQVKEKWLLIQRMH